ncbi:hypothetical protein MYAM1_000484 [Malassezia yamatoensis]|uniref:Transcription factor domain-containing protein n=1 Tax=Malassezia yamatoensis TaxID=253288 RepID=A0AAJ6CG15_9BASI|nr:hypothetical protein MYAM1_000484 [Malassezia yamatoensis]
MAQSHNAPDQLSMNSGLAQVYAPHTGNPNVRKAREREARFQQSQQADYEQKPSSSQWDPQAMGSHANESHSINWQAYDLSHNSHRNSVSQATQRNSIDYSGDEPDSDGNTVDSLDSHFNGMNWENYQVPRSYESDTSSNDHSHLLDVAGLVQHSNWTIPPQLLPTEPMTDASNTDPLGYTSSENHAKQTMESPSLRDAFSSKANPSNEIINMVQVHSAPEPIIDSFAPSLSYESRPYGRRPSDLAKLSTRNLNTAKLKLATPQTPSRFGNYAAFSPAHAAMAGSIELSSWLDEPVVPSPMYELGACTGWNGLMSAIDLSKTPNAIRANDRHSLKGPRPAGADSDAQPELSESKYGESNLGTEDSTPISPVLISSEDWWTRDILAQWRYHRYMQSTLTLTNFSCINDPRTTLAMSAISRFMVYCTFLCLSEPNSPQPPFLHRPLLLAQRKALPASLSIARCVLAALMLRLPSSEEYTWNLAARELENQIEEAHKSLAELQAYIFPNPKENPTLTFEKALEVMALCQTLWFYIVMGAFGDKLDCPGDHAFSFIHRYWEPSLLVRANGALQLLTQLIALLLPALEARPIVSTSNTFEDENAYEFLCWGLCESLRRTVLASHVLLILLRYRQEMMLHTDSSTPVSAATWGLPPFDYGSDSASSWSTSVWQKVTEVELPAVADTFEADQWTNWRSHKDNYSTRSIDRRTPALYELHRPINANDPRTEVQFHLESYFSQHDEFTNVCLSVLFGLTNDLPSETIIHRHA